jgi:hypothetical protein
MIFFWVNWQYTVLVIRSLIWKIENKGLNCLTIIVENATHDGEQFNMECHRARFWVPCCLFLIYIDLPLVLSTNNKLLLYVDNASILVSRTNINDIQVSAKFILNSLSQWFKCNGLSLNLIRAEIWCNQQRKHPYVSKAQWGNSC